MRKHWKILGAVYLAINTLFLIPIVQIILKKNGVEAFLCRSDYINAFNNSIIEWYARTQMTGTHIVLALFFIIFCLIGLDFSKRRSIVIMSLGVCLLAINICLNLLVVLLYIDI